MSCQGALLAKTTGCCVIFRELQEENRQTESERLLLDRALHGEKTTNQNNQARLALLEKDLRDMRVELEQKIEIGEQEVDEKWM